MISQREFSSLVSYNPDTGEFYNMVSRGPSKIGTRAGTKSGPYRYITIDGFKRAEHQWAFLAMEGRLPKVEIDHRNGVTDDNRWNNLRKADRFKQLANSKGRRANRLKGTILLKSGRWSARLYYKGKNFGLGNFDTEQAAYAAYCDKAKEIHGEFTRI